MNFVSLESLIKNIQNKKIYLTSDSHFFHKQMNIYANRHFPDTDDGVLSMNEYILHKYDELPDTKGTVIIDFGDVFYGKLMNKYEKEFPNYIKRMKGKNRTLILILGNHDKEILKYLKIKNITPSQFFISLGYDKVVDGGISYKDILLTHEPIAISSDSDTINVHGHTHGNCVTDDYFFNKSAIINPKAYINVCVDNTDFNFIDFHKVIKYQSVYTNYNLMCRDKDYLKSIIDSIDKELNNKSKSDKLFLLQSYKSHLVESWSLCNCLINLNNFNFTIKELYK